MVWSSISASIWQHTKTGEGSSQDLGTWSASKVIIRELPAARSGSRAGRLQHRPSQEPADTERTRSSALTGWRRSCVVRRPDSRTRYSADWHRQRTRRSSRSHPRVRSLPPLASPQPPVGSTQTSAGLSRQDKAKAAHRTCKIWRALSSTPHARSYTPLVDIRRQALFTLQCHVSINLLG